MSRSMLFTCLVAAILGAGRDAAANDIPCPVKQATWTVSPLPAPWSAAAAAGAQTKRFSAFINGKEWIICQYANKPSYPSVFNYLPGPGPNLYLLKITRPAFSNASIDEIACPANEVRAELKTAVPSPWTSTTYVFALNRKLMEEAPGGDLIACHYQTRGDNDPWSAGPSAILRPVVVDSGPGLTGTPKPDPSGPDKLTAVFGVTAATLSTSAEVRTACPATVKFRGYIHANGAGTVRYRFVHTGKPGAVREMSFDRAEGRPVLFDVQVGDGDRSGAVTTRPKPSPRGGSITAAPAPDNRLSGWGRIEILSPQGGVSRSDIASYVVTCTPGRPAGVSDR